METVGRKDWYIVFTASRAEKCVKAQLEEAGVESDFPQCEFPCFWGGREQRVLVPVLCGCIFVNVTAPRLPDVLAMRGVVDCVRKEGRPLALSKRQMASLREQLEQGKVDFGVLWRDS